MKNSVFEVNDIHNLVELNEMVELLFPVQSQQGKITTKEWTSKGKDGQGQLKFKDVVTSEHAYDRWNERIGPKVSMFEITNLMKYICTYEPDRIELYTAKQLKGSEFNYLILDKEIVAIYSIDKDVLIIRTFLGRISLKPQLQNVSSLYLFNVLAKDNTDLNVPADILEIQTVPFGPTRALAIDGESIYYQFDFANERSILKITPSTDRGLYTYKLIMLKHPHNINLSVKDLSVILKMQNKKFVAKYISTNYKNMPDLCEHYSNKALFSFKQKVLYKRGLY